MPRLPEKVVNWIVKVSKLCNLRCRYCYEWNELDQTDRISLVQWEQLLLSIRDYHDRLALDCPSVETKIIWHGGEPLLLPASYYAEVIQLQRRVLGKLLEDRHVTNGLQTNLYAVPWRTIELLNSAGFGIGVSLDVVGGVRLDLHDRETETRVAKNIDAVRSHGIPVGGIAVLGGHTAPHVIPIYNFYEALGIGMRFLPLFAAPLNTPDASFAVDDKVITDALCRLFVHWAARPRRIPIEPLVDYLWTVANFLRKRQRLPFDRRTQGEWAILVNTNGDVFQVMDAYAPQFVLGNVFKQSIDDIIRSEAYEVSMRRDDTLRSEVCTGCRFQGACNELPLYESPRGTRTGERCGYGFSVFEFIENYVRERKLSYEDIAAILRPFSRPPREERRE